MKSFLQGLGVKFDSNGLSIPEYAERIKIDVGLSVNAPQSSIWLKADTELFVFGFEPLRDNIDAIHTGKSDWPENLAPALIGEKIVVIPCALSNITDLLGRDFYVTKKDPGCSSLLHPVSMDVVKVEKVPVLTLDDFLQFFPFHRYPFIEHVKIDVQGTDFDVVKGAEKHLERIMFITMEIDTTNYVGATQSLVAVKKYMEEKGFLLVTNTLWGKLSRFFRGVKISLETDDPTFLNYKLYCENTKPHLIVFQRG
jgi:FkbM family methyltransferase